MLIDRLPPGVIDITIEPPPVEDQATVLELDHDMAVVGRHSQSSGWMCRCDP